MKTLDDVTLMKKLDPSGVLESTGMFVDQCEDAWKKSIVIDIPDSYRAVKNIVVCGMGGSRFTPKTVKELFRDRISVPYEIVEDYTVPGYVNSDSLVILSSYSGSTEEVLFAGQDARKKNAKLMGIMNGGKIADFLKEQHAPVMLFDGKLNPCNQPRIGGGYLLMGHAGLLKNVGFLDINQSEIDTACDFGRIYCSKCKPDVPESHNPAKQLARKLIDMHPFIITAEFLKGCGNGFANQINETAKLLSDYRYISELNHHLMEGLKRPDTVHTSGLFVFIRSKLYSSVIQKRFDITKAVVEKQNVKSLDIMLSGTTPLSQALELFTLSGYASFYLAMLYESDPVAIPWVDYFKAQLAKK